MPKYEQLIWTGDKGTSLEQYKDVDILLVNSEPIYYATLFRFLTILLREYDLEVVLTPEMEETAEITGFTNLL